ncbi:hypothetical protein lerEdw1_002606 [Lerista edwardsae]|nr:hypothetical protein lerEdw1_002606 [Lerista edwardsae]
MWREILAHRNYLINWLIPFILLPLPLLVPYKEAQCGYTIIVMALLWSTEALPLAITSLLPVVLFPLMGIMESKVVCMEYLTDTSMLFIGGMLVAIAVEYWNLHKRIALRILLIVGVKPALLLMGFMGVTAFLSMWISNTATTAMMVPIAHVVLEQLHKSEQESSSVEQVVAKNGNINGGFELQEAAHQPAHVLTVEKVEVLPVDQQEQKYQTVCKGMSLAVCYAASIGGIATLTGTTPNLVMQGQMDRSGLDRGFWEAESYLFAGSCQKKEEEEEEEEEKKKKKKKIYILLFNNTLFPENGNVVNFASWFSFAFPVMVVLLLVSWLWLQLMFLGFDFKKNFGCSISESEKMKSKRAYGVIKSEHQALGPMKFSEIVILILFIVLVLLWFTREPGFMPGWATAAFNHGEMRYSRLLALLFQLRHGCDSGHVHFFTAVCDSLGDSQLLQSAQDPERWQVGASNRAWVSGLSEWLGRKLTPLQNIPHPAIAFLLSLLVAVFTECTSNVATTTLFLPILASMSQAICIHPLYVMLPCTLAASLAFMLPVATPPNAIVFSFGQLRVIDMVKAGSMLNLLGVLTISLAINTWGIPVFDLHQFPSWANSTYCRSPEWNASNPDVVV